MNAYCGRIKAAHDFIPDCDQQIGLFPCKTMVEEWGALGCEAEVKLLLEQCWAVYCDEGASVAYCEAVFVDLQECIGYDPDA